jgi:hypothetical protein
MRRRLKKSFRCALVVATLTSRQLRSTYSWISARIQWSANEDEADAALGIEAADGLHQPDIAFLDQVRLRQPVAHVLPADGDHEPQMGKDELLGSVKVVVADQPAAELDLLLGSKQGKAIYRLDVLVEAPQRCRGGHCQRGTGHVHRSPRRRRAARTSRSFAAILALERSEC